MNMNTEKKTKLSLNSIIAVATTIIAVTSLLIALCALKIANNQLEFQEKEDRTNLIVDCSILENLFFRLNKMWLVPKNNIFIDEAFREQTVQYLQELKSIIKQGLDNNLLKMNDQIYSHWRFFDHQIESTLRTIIDEQPLEKYYGITIPHVYFKEHKEVSKNEYVVEQLEIFKEWIRIFWEKGGRRIMGIKEVQQYRQKYLDLSNRGRDF